MTHAAAIVKTLCALTACALIAACGGGGSDVNITVPNGGTGEQPGGGGQPGGGTGQAAWIVSAYDYWFGRGTSLGEGTTTLLPDRSFIVSNLSLKFTVPYTSGCAVAGAQCAERLSAAAVMVCPLNQPSLVMVDSRAARVIDTTGLRGKTFRAIWYCNEGTTGTATVSSSGDLTVHDGPNDFPLGSLSALISSGEFVVRRVDTPNGARHVLVERQSNDFVAFYVEQ
jgi:hypothetical protein